ncbi:MAG UNVERIFIED_CONTAM: hypothetical protein LVR18_18295 [Planctomycetaceae bacterium]|jgi:hypothetical protein
MGQPSQQQWAGGRQYEIRESGSDGQEHENADNRHTAVFRFPGGIGQEPDADGGDQEQQAVNNQLSVKAQL